MPREGRALNNFTQPTSWSRDEGKKAADALEQAFKVDSPCLLAQGVQRYEVPFAIAEAALACLGSTTYVPDFGGAAGNKSNIKLPPAKDCGSTNNEVLRLLVLLASQEQKMENGRTFLECKRGTQNTLQLHQAACTQLNGNKIFRCLHSNAISETTLKRVLKADFEFFRKVENQQKGQTGLGSDSDSDSDSEEDPVAKASASTSTLVLAWSAYVGVINGAQSTHQAEATDAKEKAQDQKTAEAAMNAAARGGKRLHTRSRSPSPRGRGGGSGGGGGGGFGGFSDSGDEREAELQADKEAADSEAAGGGGTGSGGEGGGFASREISGGQTPTKGKGKGKGKRGASRSPRSAQKAGTPGSERKAKASKGGSGSGGFGAATEQFMRNSAEQQRAANEVRLLEAQNKTKELDLAAKAQEGQMGMMKSMMEMQMDQQKNMMEMMKKHQQVRATAPPLHPHCTSHYCTLAAAPSLHSHCTLTALPLHSHCTPIAPPLHSHCTPTALSLHSHCIPTAPPLPSSRSRRYR